MIGHMRVLLIAHVMTCSSKSAIGPCTSSCDEKIVADNRGDAFNFAANGINDKYA